MLALAPANDGSPPSVRDASLDQAFEVMARAVLEAGLHWSVVDRRWAGIERALAGFDARAVAAFEAEDVDRLMADASVVRHRPKLDAIVHNARRLVALADEHGSFAAWLAGLGDHDAACAAIRSEFRWLGARGAAWVLRVLGGPAPG